MRGGALIAVMMWLSTGAVLADLPPMLESPARLGPARPADDIEPGVIRPVSLNLPQDDGPRIVPEHIAEAGTRTPPVRRLSIHPIDDFLEPRPREKKAATNETRHKFGDRFKDLFDPAKPSEWLFSDHGFDCIASPISNPFLAEDPRALTEIRPVFMYQKVPGEQPNFKGGNIWFFGARGGIAFTERWSLTLDKLGGINFAPSNGQYPSDFSFAEVWLGPKYTFYRDLDSGAVAAGGIIFQIPSGSQSTFQDTGSLGLTPYLSVGKTLGEYRLGAFNGISTLGYTFATDSQRNEFFYWSNHLDFDVGNHHRFYPVLELNYFQYGRGGQTQFSGVGHDIANIGTQNTRNASLVTGAVGARFKILEAAQLGAAFELPLMGNRDLFQYRITMDLIIRY